MVLCLNKGWKIVGQKTVKEAIIALCGSGAFKEHSEATDYGLDIQYNLNDKGEPDFNSTPSVINPVLWADWIQLPIRDWDLVITTPHRDIRVPTVIVTVNYAKIPIKKFRKKPTRETVWFRDKGICQYSGQPLKKDDASIDHVIPKSRGGLVDDWKNVVLCHKEINANKGNRLNSEVGLKLIREPTIPKSMPISDMIVTAKHSDWNVFIKK